jgi:ferrochelatase
MTRSIAQYERGPLDPAKKTGLILCGMGGPDGPDAVEPFLRNLFADPEIFPLPKLIAGFLGRRIARKRAPKVRRSYALVSKDCVTPQLELTWRQAERVAADLSAAGRPTLPGMAMRYWHPFPVEGIAELLAAGAEQFLVVPTYPQFSWSTNGSTIDFVLAGLAQTAPGAPVHVIADWHLLDGYLQALARPVIRNLAAWAAAETEPHQTGLFYVAHSMPESVIRKGDPYLVRTLETVAAVHALVVAALQRAGHGAWLADLMAGGPEAKLVFQSKVGPIKWLGPEIAAETPRLAALGLRRLFVQPISFTCEHIETMLELGIELKETAHTAGITDFRRGPALNLSPVWLDSLTDLLARQAFAPEGSRHAAQS